MSWTRYVSKAPLLAVFVALVLSGCGDGIKPLTPGTPAPKGTLTLLDGSTEELPGGGGKGRIITFMSSWCPCSNDSIPMMKKAYKLHGENGHVSFLMIGIQDARKKFVEVNKKWQVPFPVGFDSSNEIARAYGIKQPPTTVFVGKDGKVTRFFYGNIKDVEEDFYKWIEELV